jgi:hypothetical protein
MLLKRVCFFSNEHFKILVDCSICCFENHGRLNYNMNAMSMGYITRVIHARKRQHQHTTSYMQTISPESILCGIHTFFSSFVFFLVSYPSNFDRSFYYYKTKVKMGVL